MRYALIFAGVAAAYDAYGYEASSSAPAATQTSTVPAYGGYGEGYKASSSLKVGYTTIYPGYGKQPVTVTSQYQAYPTCGAASSGGKSCEKWNEDHYVSTVIEDCESKKITVTYIEKPITVYHTKSTITHYPTATSTVEHGQAYSTGSYGYNDKNSTKPWYEMYEKVHEIKYKDLGAHGLPGYGGSGLCKSCDDEQPYKVKEYKNGKWSEYETTANYKAPTPEVKTYEKPGVYTESAKDVTVTYAMTQPSEATTTAKAGVPVTYGGYTTDFKETGVKTCAYGAYETGTDKYGNDVTSTVVKTVTVTVSSTGMYEVAKPTTTVYDHDTEVMYPTVSVYQPGVYHKDAQTVTITKSGDTYSCEYKQTKTYPATPMKTPSNGDEYPHGDKYTVTASVPAYPESTPAYGESSSTPCSSSVPAMETESKSIEYPVYPTGTVPAYGESSSTPCSSSLPAMETETKSMEYPVYPTGTVPAYGESSSTPCSSSTPAMETETKSIEYPSYPASSSVPSYGEYESSSAPVYPATATVPVYHTKSTPCPSSTVPVEAMSTYPAYPAASSSAPVYPVAASSAPAYEASPTPSSAGYGYSKRSGAVQRRQAAKRSN
ncbi:hypothetical protein EJ07DRAFT_134270 [Lizonia empirigonia]|nr:hypothetical protein EJ07DRAFT_134270 [Lizonia empirigonia]